MATRPQLERLARRIDSLAAAHRPTRFAVIRVGVDETKEVAAERHYSEHLEDRDASHVVVVQFVAAINGRPAKDGEVTDHGR